MFTSLLGPTGEKKVGMTSLDPTVSQPLYNYSILARYITGPVLMLNLVKVSFKRLDSSVLIDIKCRSTDEIIIQ